MAESGSWDLFFQLNVTFPVIFFTLFLLLSLIYWCFTFLGVLDIDVFDVDADMDADANADVGSVAGLLMKLGLNGVPITIIISLIAFFGWLISLMSVNYLVPLVPTALLKMVFSIALFFIALYLATMITAFAIRPIRPIFLNINKENKVTIIGQTAVVRTGTVDEQFGEANLDDGGAGLIIKVRAYAGQSFTKGDRVVVLEHDPLENTYKIISEQEYQSN